MTEGIFLGILAIFFTPAFTLLGWIGKKVWSIDKHLIQINSTIEKHDKVYKACPFCPEKEG